MENRGTLTIEFILGNDCFEPDPAFELHRLLSVAAIEVLENDDVDGMKLIDVNGNIVGEINHE